MNAPPPPTWATRFDQEILERGQALCEQGAVAKVSIEPLGTFVTLTAEVRDGAEEPFRPKLRLLAPTYDRKTGLSCSYLDGTCNCRPGRLCEHTAALMNFYVRFRAGKRPHLGGAKDSTAAAKPAKARKPATSAPAKPPPPKPEPPGPDLAFATPQGPSDRPLKAWLSTLEETADRSRTDDAQRGRRVMYLLRPDHDAAADEFILELATGKRRQNGWLIEARSVGVHHLLRHQRGAGLRLENTDLRVLHVLQQLSAMPRTDSQFQVRGHRLTEVLSVLAHTGRLFWRDQDDRALTAGDPRPLPLVWRHDLDGYRLVFGGSQGLRPLPVLPPWYLDLDTGQLGQILTRLPPGTLRTLLDMPGLSAVQIRAALPGLCQAIPDCPEPPEETRALTVATPQPVLHLYQAKLLVNPFDWNNEWQTTATLGLAAFAYGQALVRPDADGEAVGGPEGAILYRDRAAEERLLRQLSDCGLIPLSTHGNVDYPIRHKEDAAHTYLCWPSGLPRNAARARAMSDLPIPSVSLALLQAQGWKIACAGTIEPPELLDAGGSYVDLKEGDAIDWFEMHLGIRVGDQRLDLLPLLRRVIDDGLESLDNLPAVVVEDRTLLLFALGERTMVRVPKAIIERMCRTLMELFDQGEMGEDAARVARGRAHLLGQLDELTPEWLGSERLRAFATTLARIELIAPVAPPTALQATLRPYQVEGLSWLQFIAANGLGGILADDMGLGKTVEAIAHLLAEREHGRLDRPSLVLAPRSVIANWQRELQRFAPDLRVMVLHGQGREALLGGIQDHDVVVTTYATACRDEDVLAATAFHAVILDEAQAVKNVKTQAAQLVRKIDARHRLCLTGTPVENHLGELWAHFDFLNPGLLGSREHFQRAFRAPIERGRDRGRLDLLRRRIRPFLLRRTKDAVAKDLPPKTEILHTVTLEEEQRSLYESVRAAMDERVRSALAGRGLAKSHIIVLDALLKLRQVCCDPRLLPAESAHQVRDSAKLEALLDLLPELIEDGRRILLFSQFTSMLALIQAELDERGIAYCLLTGETDDRQGQIDRFQAGEVPLFLLSLKAGGFGINLTAADTVIHYDPWWNPAVEAQATDRAHRIGQDKPVFVYKLVVAGTVEEKILGLQARKRELADGLYDEQGQAAGPLSEADIRSLFEPIEA